MYCFETVGYTDFALSVFPWFHYHFNEVSFCDGSSLLLFILFLFLILVYLMALSRFNLGCIYVPMAHLKYPVPVLPDSAKHKFGCWSDLTVHCHIYNFERYSLAFIKGLHLLILSLLYLGNWATFFCGDLIRKYFLRSFSPFHWFKKGRCQFLAKECAHYLLTT